MKPPKSDIIVAIRSDCIGKTLVSFKMPWFKELLCKNVYDILMHLDLYLLCYDYSCISFIVTPLQISIHSGFVPDNLCRGDWRNKTSLCLIWTYGFRNDSISLHVQIPKAQKSSYHSGQAAWGVLLSGLPVWRDRGGGLCLRQSIGQT